MFRDREEAGEKLGMELSKLQLHQPVVLALPRGGVPVAVEVASSQGSLDVLVVRKGRPRQSELAVAAIVDGDPSTWCSTGRSLKPIHSTTPVLLFGQSNA